MNKRNKLTPSLCRLMFHFLTYRSNICPICQQTSECPTQRTMIAMLPKNDWLQLGIWYKFLPIYHFLTPNVTWSVRFIKHLSPYCMLLRVNVLCIYFLANKNTTMAVARCSLWEDLSGNVAVFNVRDVRVTSSS